MKPRPGGAHPAIEHLSAFDHNCYKVHRWALNSGMSGIDNKEELAHPQSADIITSRIVGTDYHTVMIDLDVPARLVPSSTPGNSHLYIDVPITWGDYMDILRTLTSAGIVQRGFYNAAKRRKWTALRLPWCKKEGCK